MKTTDLKTCKATGIMFRGRRSQRAEDIKNDFWNWCQSNKLPFVFVYTHQGKANVSYDMPSGSGSIDLIAKKKLMDGLIPFGYEKRPLEEMGGGVLDVPLEQAEAVAKLVLEVGRDFCARCVK